MNYTLYLDIEKSKKYRPVSQWLIFFNFLGFIFLLTGREELVKGNFWILVSLVVTGFYTLFAVLERITKKQLPDLWHRLVFIFCSLAWWMENYVWLSVLMLLVLILDYLAHQKPVVKVSEKELILPAALPRKVNWKELNNVLLKDEMLTVDFRNNKLFQHAIRNTEPPCSEKEFNEFCRSMLNKPPSHQTH